MNAEYSTLLFERQHLIVKTIEGRTPFVIGSIYLPEMAQTICDLLTKFEAEKLEEKQNEN